MGAKTRNLTKKVIVTDELSTPEARAERLRRIRNMANLSRQTMCAFGNLNINTYKGWEIARYGGLPVDGAHKVIQYLSKAGVVCTSDWLLYGRGMEPYIIPKFIDTASNKKIKDRTQDDKHILHEIMHFQTQYPNTIYAKVDDDGLSPKFNPGDFVAGVRWYGKDIRSLIGKDCILRTQDGAILIRHLKAVNSDNTFTLLCTNALAPVNKPVLYNVSLESAAPIIRLYRIDTKIK